jgi:hypothetical protein
MDSITAEEWETGYGPLSTTPEMMSEPSHVNGKAPSVPADKSAKGEIEDDSDDEEPESCGECSASAKKRKVPKFKKFYESLPPKEKCNSFILFMFALIDYLIEQNNDGPNCIYTSVDILIKMSMKCLPAVKQMESFVKNNIKGWHINGSSSLKQIQKAANSHRFYDKHANELPPRNPELNLLIEQRYGGLFLSNLCITKSRDGISLKSNEADFSDDSLGSKKKCSLNYNPRISETISASKVVSSVKPVVSSVSSVETKFLASQKMQEMLLNTDDDDLDISDYLATPGNYGLHGFMKLLFNNMINGTLSEVDEDGNQRPTLFDSPFISKPLPFTLADLKKLGKPYFEQMTEWIKKPSSMYYGKKRTGFYQVQNLAPEDKDDIFGNLTRKYKVPLEIRMTFQIVALKNKLKVEELFLTNDLAFVKKCTKK